MCTNQRLITNPYTKQKFYVPCGHCKACQQAKAVRRKRRIENNVKSGFVALSVMLSYDRYAVPFVYRSDVESIANDDCFAPHSLRVMRGCIDRYVRVGSRYDVALHRKKDLHPIDVCYISNVDWSLNDVPQDLKHGEGKIGVLFYKDIQDFNKRLKQNLIRNYHYDGKYSYFVTGEYGETTLRPHWHLLVFCRISDVQFFRSAIIKSWTYGNMRKERRIEIAKNMASYVASYVNCGNEFPSFLSKNFPPKCHFSMGFGTLNSAFSLPSLKEKVRRGDLSYNIYSSTSPTGFVSVQIPKYVVNRFFPQFKGCTRIAHSTLFDVLQTGNGFRLLHDSRYSELNYTSDDLSAISARLRHSFERYNAITGGNMFDYAIDYVSTWTTYNSNLLRNLHCRIDSPPLNERYYNLHELFVDCGQNRYGFGDLGFDFVEVNPNNFSSVISETKRLTDCFDNLCKYKKVNNTVLSSYDDEF